MARGWNRIEFRVRPDPAAVEQLAVTPYVDGVSLVELARRVEMKAGDPELAGRYAGLTFARGHRWQDRYDGTGPEVWFGDGDSCLLGCTCGNTGCWPLTAIVTVGADAVVWERFRTGHRPWDLSRLGRFRFRRADYDAALENPVVEEA